MHTYIYTEQAGLVGNTLFPSYFLGLCARIAYAAYARPAEALLGVYFESISKMRYRLQRGLKFENLYDCDKAKKLGRFSPSTYVYTQNVHNHSAGKSMCFKSLMKNNLN